MEKKVIIISKFYRESENSRANLVYKFFKEKGYKAKIICSDFSHSKKIKTNYKNESNLIIIKTQSYKKNISLERVYSHIKFSFDALNELKKEKCELVYIILPPNILGYLISKYCKKNKIKIISDVIDLWPESLPVPKKIKNILDGSINILWKKLRVKTLERSDYIITESNYFYDKLKLEKYNNSKVILLKKIIKDEIKKNNLEKFKIENNIKIVYLGNIGKIYDFKALIEILKKLSQKVEVLLEIIGIGEEKDSLIYELDKNQIKYNFYGPIYEEDKKMEIIKKCDFGFNGYKKESEVALSYKSIDYFSYGIPIINSAKGDTWDMIEKYSVGINYQNIDKKLIENILIYNKKNNDIIQFFYNKFSYKSLVEDLEEVINCIN